MRHRPSTARPSGRPRFYRRSMLGGLAALGIRVGAALAFVGVALAGHWFDRGGLRDNVDGHVSFIDVVYFTMITVTTVGYGDIVPVTDRARLFDTFVVTPVRIFVWLIFLGTAYTFLFRHTWERWRMARVQAALTGHNIICGYGATGEAAAAELMRRGVPPGEIVVVDQSEDVLLPAEEAGLATVHGDATHNAVLTSAGVARACAVIIAPGRDDTAVLVALTVRRLAPDVSVSVSVRAIENEILARDAGADIIVNPVSFGGQLLAGSTLGVHTADYVADLVTSGGHVELRERAVVPDEVGRSLRSLETGAALRLYRGGRAYGFWEPEARALAAGDTIIEVMPNPDEVAARQTRRHR